MGLLVALVQLVLLGKGLLHTRILENLHRQCNHLGRSVNFRQPSFRKLVSICRCILGSLKDMESLQLEFHLVG